MGGDSAINGFLIQAYMCLMDALGEEWDSVKFDHNGEEHVVDIRWTLCGGGARITQVKANQSLTQRDIDSVVEDLLRVSAVSRELVLIGCQGRYAKAKSRDPRVKLRLVQFDTLDAEAYIGRGLAKLKEHVQKVGLEDLTLVEGFRYFHEGTARLFESSTLNREYSRDDLLALVGRSFQNGSENSLRRELKEIDQFVQLFGFEPARELRKAIIAVFATQKGMDRRTIARLRPFFRPVGGELAVGLDAGQWGELVVFTLLLLSGLALIAASDYLVERHAYWAPAIGGLLVPVMAYLASDYYLAIRHRRIRQKLIN